jgi:Ca-activated chloride channel family protein
VTRSNRAIREVEERLAAGPKPVPPQDLLQQIVDEIPEDLGAESGDRGSSTRWWKLAAAVVLVVGGGIFARQVIREAPTVEEFASREVERAERERRDPAPASAAPNEARQVVGQETGEVEARVVDEQGVALPGVTVTLVDKTGAATRVQTTNAEGRVRFPGLDPGRWRVRFELEGFGRVEYPATEVRSNRATALEVTLPVAAEEVISVTSGSSLLDERKPVEDSTAEFEEIRPTPEPLKILRESPAVLEDRIDVRGGQEPGAVDSSSAEPERMARSKQERSKRPQAVPPPEPLVDADMTSSAMAYRVRVGAEDQREEGGERNRELLMLQRPRQATPAAPSTGGTAEPNDQPYGDMFFGSYGENPFIDTEDDALSTFGLDVDTGSWTLVRSYVDRGSLPPRDAVRVEELVNAFDYGDPAPRRGDFELVAEGARTPYGESSDYHLLRFGLRARDVLRRGRPPAMLIFTVDTSGSMAQENRLGLVKRSLELLVEELGPHDEVGLVTFGSSARVVLDPTADRGEILRALDWLRPEGSTNAEHGLRTAYDLIQRYRREGSLHRVILCSDGVANVGNTGPDSILESIGRWARDGIELTTIGFGMGNYNDLLMEQLADRGDGRYHYVDTLDEARRVFVDDLAGTLVTVAEEARAQVELHPEAVERYRLLGYENRDIADRDFRNETVDAGEIGAGHHVTSLYEVKLRDGLRAHDVVATLRLRYRSAETGRWEELAHDLTAGELAERWERAPRSLRLAGTVAELAELLKGTYWAREGDLESLSREADDLARESRGDAEVAELARVARRAAELTGRGRTEEE